MAKGSPERTADYRRDRAKRANRAEAMALLESFGTDAPLRSGDELSAPLPEPAPLPEQ